MLSSVAYGLNHTTHLRYGFPCIEAVSKLISCLMSYNRKITRSSFKRTFKSLQIISVSVRTFGYVIVSITYPKIG